jgi:hypothetical protein
MEHIINSKKGCNMKCTKQEQEFKNCLIRLLQDYNGSWDNLKKEKEYKQLIKYYKLKKGE